MVDTRYDNNVFSQFDNVDVRGSQVAFKQSIIDFTAEILDAVEKINVRLDVDYRLLQESIEEVLYTWDFELYKVTSECIVKEYVIAFGSCLDESILLLKDVDTDWIDIELFVEHYSDANDLDYNQVIEEVEYML